MAGAGYKLFQTGDVLTATEVNTYLQQQVTMVFADSAARTTALSGVLAEGMMSYLQDTNLVEVYDGSSWVSVGNTGDITGVTAGAGLTGGGTSGTVTLTNDMATTITAKGDLLVGTGSATYDNLAVGTDGYTLVADSTEATGLKWAAPSGASYVGFSGDTNNSETIANTTYTEFTMEVEQWDTDGFHSTVTNTGRVTIPAGKAGKYLISGAVMWNSAIDADNEVRAVIYKNGNQERFFNAFTSSAGDEPYAPNYTCVLNLAEGDYIQLYRWQNTGGNESAGNGSPLTVTYLGA